MVIDLGNVNTEKKEYIQEEGYMTLKVVEVRHLKNSSNNNPIFRFTYKNKHDKYLSEDEQEPIQDEIENKWAYEEGRY